MNLHPYIVGLLMAARQDDLERAAARHRMITSSPDRSVANPRQGLRARLAAYRHRDRGWITLVQRKRRPVGAHAWATQPPTSYQRGQWQ
jgi:hypothetical protein